MVLRDPPWDILEALSRWEGVQARRALSPAVISKKPPSDYYPDKPRRMQTSENEISIE